MWYHTHDVISSTAQAIIIKLKISCIYVALQVYRFLKACGIYIHSYTERPWQKVQCLTLQLQNLKVISNHLFSNLVFFSSGLGEPLHCKFLDISPLLQQTWLRSFKSFGAGKHLKGWFQTSHQGIAKVRGVIRGHCCPDPSTAEILAKPKKKM